jgi:hypothetical protein
VTTASSTPVTDVFGFFQIFAMKFMRKAPRKEKGGRGRPGFVGIWKARRDSACFRARKRKSRPAAGVFHAQPLVSILRISPHSSAAVVAVWARGGKPLLVQIQNGSAPRRHPLQGEGVLIRPARRFHLLSDYFLAYAFPTN